MNNKIVIIVEGGVCQAVYESQPCVIDEVILIDHDNLKESYSRERRDEIVENYTGDLVERPIVDVADLEAST